jgi:hypothetical protein
MLRAPDHGQGASILLNNRAFCSITLRAAVAPGFFPLF